MQNKKRAAVLSEVFMQPTRRVLVVEGSLLCGPAKLLGRDQVERVVVLQSHNARMSECLQLIEV